jgi:hypothetical protein
MAAVLTVGGGHGRPVVNRRFPATYRGPLAILAGGLDYSVTGDRLLVSTLADAGLQVDTLPTYAVIARAELVDSHRAAGPCCRPWGSTSPSYFHLVLADVRALSEPVRGFVPRPGMPEPTTREHNAILAVLTGR